MTDSYKHAMYARDLQPKLSFIEHEKELVLQSWARLIFTGAGRGSAKQGFLYDLALTEKLNQWKSAFEPTKDMLGAMRRYVIMDSWTTLSENLWIDCFAAAEWMYRFESKNPSWDIRMQVVKNMGLEPEDAVYVAIRNAVPKRSTLLTVDYSEVEKRLLAYYYGMSEPRSRKEFEDLYLYKYTEPEAYQPQFHFHGTVTGRFSSRDIPPLSERARDWRPNPRGRRY